MESLKPMKEVEKMQILVLACSVVQFQYHCRWPKFSITMIDIIDKGCTQRLGAQLRSEKAVDMSGGFTSSH
jgi:hypothetical protein